MFEDVSGPRLLGLAGELSLLIDAPDWDHASGERVLAFLETVRALAREEQALDLRIARVLAWLRTQDLSELGFSSWTAFRDEHCGWGATWTRQLIRLVESPLALVREAVCRGLVPMRLAVLAPGKVKPQEQAEWIERAVRGEVGPPVIQRVPVSELAVVSGREAEVVEHSREIALRLVGWRAQTERLDAFVRESWQSGVPGTVLVSRAREAPPIPERLSRPVPEWGAVADPATALSSSSGGGEWTDPTDVHDALRMLTALQERQNGRIATLGMAYTLIQVHGLWQETKHDSLASFVEHELGRSMRTFQRYANAGMDLFLWPEVRSAIASGLSVDRAELVVPVTSERTIERWLELAGKTPKLELDRATRRAATGRGAEVLDLYGLALEKGRAMSRTDKCRGVLDGLERPTFADGLFDVALRDDPEAEPAPAAMLFVHKDQVKAATWFVTNIRFDESGIRRTAARDLHTCQNPRCRATTVRVHVHHMIPLQYGGTDDPDNLVTLCPACHLRGIHSGRMKVVRDGDFLLWTWPRLRPVVMLAPRVVRA